MNIIQENFETIEDARGAIKKIAKNVDVLEISSKEGTKRAGHYHQKFGHICYLEYGEIEYYERDVGNNQRPTKTVIQSSEYFFTDANKEHLMKFTVDSWFLCFSFGSRDKEDYESETVRLDYDLEEIYNNWRE